MSDWQPIETAPKDGTQIHARRIYEGDLIAEGPAAWRTVTLGKGPLVDPLTGDVFGLPYEATGWMHPDQNYRFPEPTEWKPKP